MGRQAAGEFGIFNKTENGNSFSAIYTTTHWTAADIEWKQVGNTRKPVIPDANLVICTIQRLYSVISGQELQDQEDSEGSFDPQNGPDIELPTQLQLPPNYFDFIFVDECHRSIYGRWKKVLTYFDSARIIGLTATPGAETKEFFNNNCVINYSLEQSVSDGINVGYRVFNIDTEATMNGGIIDKGEKYQEVTVYNGQRRNTRAIEPWSYKSSDLDKAVINSEQIRLVLSTFRDAVYEELYPNRTPDLAMIPKTLIFAKNDAHASNIVSILREVFPIRLQNSRKKSLTLLVTAMHLSRVFAMTKNSALQ